MITSFQTLTRAPKALAATVPSFVHTYEILGCMLGMFTSMLLLFVM
jgi:hypothetical protein